MSSHWMTLLSTLCVINSVRSSTSETLSKDICDEKLAEAIGMFVSTTQGMQHNYLLWLHGLERDGFKGVETIRELGNFLRMDLTDPSEQRELAILLCHSPHLTFISRMFHINFEKMERFLHHYVKKVRVDGQLDSLMELGEVSMELLSWADETGYPITPLENTDAEEMVEFLQAVNKHLESNPSILRLWQKSNQHFPVGMKENADFKDIAFTLSGKHTLAELSTYLDLPKGELQVLAELNEQVLKNYISNISATMRLYKILDEYGILDLDWE